MSYVKIPSEVGLWQLLLLLLLLLLLQRDMGQLLLLQHDLRQDSDAHLATKFWQTEICMIEWQVDVDHRCLVVQTVRRQCCLHCHINIARRKKLNVKLEIEISPLWLNLPPLSPPEESFRLWQLERQRGPKEGERDPAKSSLVLTHDLFLICFRSWWLFSEDVGVLRYFHSSC